MSFAPLLLLALAVHADPVSDEALKRAIQLPVVAHEMRRDGVPEEDVDVVLDAGRKSGMGAGGTTEALEAARDAGRQEGRTDNLGAFVRERIEAGLRGQDLAAAIHAEHQARKAEREAQKAAEGDAPTDEPGKAEEARGKAEEARGKAVETKGKAVETKGTMKTGGKGQGGK